MPPRKKSGKKRWINESPQSQLFPKKGIFTKDAETIARRRASKKVSPKAAGPSVRMIQYFINRAGKSLPASRKCELEKAKKDAAGPPPNEVVFQISAANKFGCQCGRAAPEQPAIWQCER